MKYSFVKRYNPAYDAFLIRYFNQNGIEFDEKSRFEDVFPRWVFASSKKNMTADEESFGSYVSWWRLHPEARPTYYDLFVRAIGETEELSLERIRELQNQFPDNGKLIFSVREAADAISEFYRRYVREPLKTELDEGHGGREIMKFFTLEELKLLKQSKDADSDEQNESWRNKIAGEILNSLTRITSEQINAEIEQVLNEHERQGDHIRAPPHNVRARDRFWSCHHETRFVELSGYKGEAGKLLTITLTPTRGSNIVESVLGLGWDTVAFPSFTVFEERRTNGALQAENNVERVNRT